MAEATNIDTLQIEIEASSADAAKQVNALADALKRVKAESKGLGGIAGRIGKIGSGAKSAAGQKTAQKREALKRSISSVRSTETYQKERSEATGKVGVMQRLKDSFAATPPISKAYIEELRTSLSLLGKVGGVAFKSLGKIASGSLKAISFGAKLAVKGLWQLAKISIVKPFKNAASAVMKWKNAIGRIIFYRAIRSAIKMITDGFKEGTDNLYQYSRMMGTSFAPAMNKLATSALYLKNSVGAIAAPLIESVAPAVDILVDKFVSLFNVIGKTMAALTGKDTYSQAKKYAIEYGDAANEASKATKKFLLGIDELNIMDQPSGGSGFTASDYKNMFEEVEVPAATKDWAADIRAAIENGDWGGAGSILAEKVNGLVADLDTETLGQRLGEKISNGLSAVNEFIRSFNFVSLGEKFAEWVNGLVDKINPAEFGQLLSAKIQLCVDLAYGFVTGFDFSEFGTWLAGVVNGWFTGINWEEFGTLVSQGIKGVFDFAVSFITTIDWKQIGNSIHDFLVTGFDDLASWLAEVDFAGLAHDLYQNLKDFLTGIDFDSIASSLFHLLGVAFGSGVELIAGFISDVVTDIKNYFLQYIKDENGDGKFGAFEIINGLLTGIVEGVKGIGRWIKDNVFTPFITGVKDAFGIHSPSTVMAEMGGYIIDGLLLGVKNGWSSIAGFFNDKLSGIKALISDTWNSLKNLWNSSDKTINKVKADMSNIKKDDRYKSLKSSVSPDRFASGGFPTRGEMFIANEAGPELVGRIGNRSAVANTDQIVSGIASGVESANTGVINAVYAMASMVVRAIEEKDMDVQLDGQSMARNMRRYQQRMDKLQGPSLVNQGI